MMTATNQPMQNQFNKLDAQSPESRMAQMTPDEHYEYQQYLDDVRRAQGDEEPTPRDSAGEPVPEEANGAGWPGDGSGMDDLADYNQLEANDYLNE